MKRIAGYKSPDYIARRAPFDAGNIIGYNDYYDGKLSYMVLSYSTPIAEWREGVWYLNDTRYSTTTAKHQNYVYRALPRSIIRDFSIHMYDVSEYSCYLSTQELQPVAYERADRIRSYD